MPASLVATTRKWYVVPPFRPVSVPETLAVLVPLPRLTVVPLEPYEVDVPYSK